MKKIYDGRISVADISLNNKIVFSDENKLSIFDTKSSEHSLLINDCICHDIKFYNKKTDLITLATNNGLELLTANGIIYTYKTQIIKHTNGIKNIVGALDGRFLRVFDLRVRYPVSSAPCTNRLIEYADGVFWTAGDNLSKYDMRYLKNPQKNKKGCSQILDIKATKDIVQYLYVLGSDCVYRIDSDDCFIRVDGKFGTSIGENNGLVCTVKLDEMHFFGKEEKEIKLSESIKEKAKYVFLNDNIIIVTKNCIYEVQRD